MCCPGADRCGFGLLVQDRRARSLLKGTLSLSKLIVFYDMNNISIDGDTSLAFTENVYKRFKSYGWNVINNIDGHNIQQIDKSIKAAIREKNKPTLLCMKTKIGFGSPNKQGTASVHGAPLGDEELSLARQNLKWNFKGIFKKHGRKTVGGPSRACSTFSGRIFGTPAA